MKKIVCLACALIILSASVVFGACTAEDFQKELVAMQATMAALDAGADKTQQISDELEKSFGSEMEEFALLVQEAATDAAKKQPMLDKGCDLYHRINAKLNELK
jgi:uncharacterized protein HemX